jgi:hypothetical protein
LAGLVVEIWRRFWLALCNSGNTAGSRDRVIGYGAWMFGQAAYQGTERVEFPNGRAAGVFHPGNAPLLSG